MKSADLHSDKKVLIVPLSWGLGHASRIIPIIRKLKSAGMHVMVGGGPSQIKLLQEEFSDLEIIRFPYLKIRLNGRRSQIFSLSIQIPKIIIYLIRERRAVKKIIRKKKPAVIISDHCYGIRHKKIPSIFITHQLWIRLPLRIKFMEHIVNVIHHCLIRRFDECWIPDLPGEDNLSGSLSHKPVRNIKTRFIGILSRFAPDTGTDPAELKDNKRLLFIISGPERQRSRFEKIIRDNISFLPSGYHYDLIRGLPLAADVPLKGWHNHVPGPAFRQMILDAGLIICRAGYSSIMDLVILSKNAILVPTPGQSEQEYLAVRLAENKLFYSVSQSEFNIRDALRCNTGSSAGFGEFIRQSAALLDDAISDFAAGMKLSM